MRQLCAVRSGDRRSTRLQWLKRPCAAERAFFAFRPSALVLITKVSGTGLLRFTKAGEGTSRRLCACGDS
jgi:hypothetical protein